MLCSACITVVSVGSNSIQFQFISVASSRPYR